MNRQARKSPRRIHVRTAVGTQTPTGFGGLETGTGAARLRAGIRAPILEVSLGMCCCMSSTVATLASFLAGGGGPSTVEYGLPCMCR